MAHQSFFLPSVQTLPGLSNAQLFQQQQQQLQQQQQQQFLQQQQAAFAAQQFAAQQSSQFNFNGVPQYAQPQIFGAGFQNSQFNAQPAAIVFTSQPSLSNMSVLTAIERPPIRLGNGTQGNLEDHRNAVASVYYFDRGF